MSTATPLILTDRAARRICSLAGAKSQPPHLRVSVEGGGCSGFKYKFELSGGQLPDDAIIERDGARLLVDPVSIGYLAGSQVDFVDDLLGAAFKVTNPNATASCGCGTSFSL